VALDVTEAALNQRIDSLRVGFAGHRQSVLTRNQAYLRAFSPAFDERLREHDQWQDAYKQEEQDHYRSSYNVTRAVVELWSSLEMSEFPTIRWREDFLPSPVPNADPAESEARQMSYRAAKQVARQIATMREQTLLDHIRRTNLKHHAYKAVRRKNIYGHSWVKTIPDRNRRTFRVFSRIDPSTVYPVWSSFDDQQLDAILVATRRSAQSVVAQYPGSIELNKDGITLDAGTLLYQPTQDQTLDADRSFVWVEDFWLVDASYEEEVSDDAVPIRSRVINAIRVNGKIVERVEYPGWTALPYVPWAIDNERDQLGFSDVATMLPIQDSINRFLSQQQDVIAGESRPKFKYRGDADREIILSPEQVVSLDPDEDIEQIQVRLDVFPTQIHGQQILEVLARATGLPDTVWGRITAAQNSGRALATAWRSVAARLVPRTYANEQAIKTLLGLWIEWMELYNWNEARDLYNGNHDFDLDFPNQEPRDFSEVSLEAINRYNVGAIDLQKLMELTGEQSPDEMLERVRAEYMDMVLHPDKGQAFLLLTRLKNQIAIEVQQAGMAMAQMAAEAAAPAAGAPGGAGTPDQQAGAAAQAGAQAAAGAQPSRTEGQNAPASAQGEAGGATQFGTLVQDGETFNRIIDKGEIA
jgi:hypothetical protein